MGLLWTHSQASQPQLPKGHTSNSLSPGCEMALGLRPLAGGGGQSPITKKPAGTRLLTGQWLLGQPVGLSLPPLKTTKRRAATFPETWLAGGQSVGELRGAVWAWPAWASSFGVEPFALLAPTCQRDSGQGHCPRGQKPLQERAGARKAQRDPIPTADMCGQAVLGRGWGWGTLSGWAGQGWARLGAHQGRGVGLISQPRPPTGPLATFPTSLALRLCWLEVERRASEAGLQAQEEEME